MIFYVDFVLMNFYSTVEFHPSSALSHFMDLCFVVTQTSHTYIYLEMYWCFAQSSEDSYFSTILCDKEPSLWLFAVAVHSHTCTCTKHCLVLVATSLDK